MDHTEAIRLTAAERYLLNELSAEQRDEFEEHFFGCSECALDLRTTAVFIEQSKRVFAEGEPPVAPPRMKPAPTPSGWFGWLRPAFAVPAFAVLLAVLVYQNLVTYPQALQAQNQPHVMRWVPINTRTRGGTTPPLVISRGSGFLLFVSIPPDPRYSSYVAELYNPAGKREWTLTIAGSDAEDAFPVQVPPGNRDRGMYSLVLRGMIDANNSTEIGRTSFELQIEK